ncbi:MAG: GlsB/YeaQ/YmgE family stress response membrane protein [Pseudomonadota bacterium]
MGLFWAIFFGFVAGLLAQALRPGGKQSGLLGYIVPIIAGMAGAFLANRAGRAMDLYPPNQLGGFVAAIVGAVVLLAAWGYLTRKSGRQLTRG